MSLEGGEHGIGKGEVSVVTGLLDEILGRGIIGVLRENSYHLLASELRDDVLESVVAEQEPKVAIVAQAVDYGLLLRLKGHHAPTGVIVIAGDPPHLLGTMLLTVGATCLPLNASARDLLDAIDLTARGDSVFMAANGRRIQRPSLARTLVLTEREKQTYELMASGKSDAAIALAMEISVATVRAHARAVFRKLDIRSRRDLASTSLLQLGADQGVTIPTPSGS